MTISSLDGKSFTVQDIVGSGGYAKVFSATITKDEEKETVALKVSWLFFLHGCYCRLKKKAIGKWTGNDDIPDRPYSQLQAITDTL